MRWFISLLVLVCCGFGVHAQQSATCPGAPRSRLIVGQQARISAEGGINMRERPNTLAERLDIVPQDDIIPVIDGPFCGEGFTWWEVDYRSQRGWIAEGTGEFYWMQPYSVQSAQVGTIRLEAVPELTTGITFSREPDHILFQLNGYPVSDETHVPRLYMYNEWPQTPEADAVATILENRAYICLDEHCPLGRAISNFAFLDNPGGFRYTALEIETDTKSVTLLYHFRYGDDDHYIEFDAPLLAPDVPLPYTPPEDSTAQAAYQSEYIEATEALLNNYAPDNFTPSLIWLDNLMLSLQVNAPLAESDVFTFDYEGALQFEYNPILAYEITSEIVTDAALPDHLQFELRGYPLDREAALQVYTTVAMDNNWLIGLQQILARQSARPPRVPILARNAEVAQGIEQVAYLNHGIRAVVTYADGLWYSYQAISVDNTYYLSLLLPITLQETTYFPPLTVLDMLVESINLNPR